MAEKSNISWTNATFNPFLGCLEVSPACDNCYARTLVTGRMGKDVWGKDKPRPRTSASYWKQPIKWNREAEAEGERRRVFCGSLCDVMEDAPWADLQAIRKDLYDLIEATPWLDWLLLTKRPQNFRRFLPMTWLASPRPNVWGMTTVESSEYFWRVDALRDTPFIVRGLSMEPLLDDVSAVNLDRIHWVIGGGESGSKARPPHPAWARRLRDTCIANDVAFHWKQWGSLIPITTTDGKQILPFGDYQPSTGFGFLKNKHHAEGALIDGAAWQQFPQVRP